MGCNLLDKVNIIRIYVPHIKTRLELTAIIDKFKAFYKAIINERTLNANSYLLYKIIFLFLNPFLDRRKIKANYIIINSFKAERKIGYKKLLSISRTKFELLFGRFLNFDDIIFIFQLLKFSKNKKKEIYFFVTEIESIYDYILALSSGNKTFVYVYSWDHIYKNVYYSKRVTRYFVWNKHQKEALNLIHNIPKQKISVVGATLLTHVYDFKLNNIYDLNKNKNENKSILLLMSTGTKRLQKQELILFEKIIKLNSKHSFYIRLYPFFKTEELSILQKYENFLGLDSEICRIEDIHSDFHINKFQIMKNFDTVMHCGTTLGLEASLLGIKSYFIHGNLIDRILKQFNNQSQLKWLLSISTYSPNSINLLPDLMCSALENEVASNYFPLTSIEEITEKILSEVNKCS